MINILFILYQLTDLILHCKIKNGCVKIPLLLRDGVSWSDDWAMIFGQVVSELLNW